MYNISFLFQHNKLLLLLFEIYITTFRRYYVEIIIIFCFDLFFLSKKKNVDGIYQHIYTVLIQSLKELNSWEYNIISLTLLTSFSDRRNSVLHICLRRDVELKRDE